MSDKNFIVSQYVEKAEKLKDCINLLLWNEEKEFYIPIPQWSPQKLPFADEKRSARELFGYLPWVFDVAPRGRSVAFRTLLEREGFCGKFGLTTVERRSPQFGIFYTSEELNRWLNERGEKDCGPLGHECLWNGPVWPFATSFALTACANMLSSGEVQDNLTANDYLKLLHVYAASHIRITENGQVLPWIDENMNPDTGDWISRTRLMNWGGKYFPAETGGYERGKDYNHSTFCDNVLEGLFGIRPSADSINITPLFPAEWDYAQADNLYIHEKNLKISYERTRGYEVTVDGKKYFTSPEPESCRLCF